jgi:hypothetical protein
VGDLWKVRPKLTVNYGLRYIRDTGRDDAAIQPPAILNQLFPNLGNKTAQPTRILDRKLDSVTIRMAQARL